MRPRHPWHKREGSIYRDLRPMFTVTNVPKALNLKFRVIQYLRQNPYRARSSMRQVHRKDRKPPNPPSVKTTKKYEVRLVAETNVGEG